MKNNIMENGGIIKNKERVFSNGLMERSIKEIS
jgi:hypothetical protein